MQTVQGTHSRKRWGVDRLGHRQTKTPRCKVITPTKFGVDAAGRSPEIYYFRSQQAFIQE